MSKEGKVLKMVSGYLSHNDFISWISKKDG